MKQALLLSGGMDSVALAYQERPDMAITIDYGQKPAQAEIQSASQLCKELNIQHKIISTDMSNIGSGDLSDTPAITIAPAQDWWPFRNQMLITLAGMFALGYGISELIIGCVASDSNHVDGREDFIEVISQLMGMQEGGIIIKAPAIHKTSDELIKESGIPMELLAWAHSCHTSALACGYCRGCIKHKNITHALGLAPY